MAPHLVTALKAPINELEQRLLDATPVIERWFREEWMEHTPPLYCEVSVRNAGFKLAPIGTNLFADGWHNLSPDTLPLAAQAARAAIEKTCPRTRNLLIVPKSGELSSVYLASLERMQRIFSMARLNVRIGSIDPALKADRELPLGQGQTLALSPARLERFRLGLKHFDPCTVLLNDGLEHGTPGILEELREQHLMPPLRAGLTVRRKSLGLHCYDNVSKSFGKLIGVDPWLIAPLFSVCGALDLRRASDFDALREEVDALLAKLQHKYREYRIGEKPFVMVKADQGPCGTGVVTVRSACELQTPGAGGLAAADLPPGRIVVQEGVITNERIQDAAAEPVVYAIGQHVVGGFYRFHADRRHDENLNAPGARHVPLPLVDQTTRLPPAGGENRAQPPDRFYMYSVMARLGVVAASHELEATELEPA